MLVEQSPHKANLYCSVPQQEECGKNQGAVREMLHRVHEKIGDKVVVILAEFAPGENLHQSIDLSGIHKKQDNAPDDFEHAVNGFANQTDIEEEVNRLVSIVVLSHFYPN